MQLRTIYSVMGSIMLCRTLEELEEVKAWGRSLDLDQEDKDILNPLFANRKKELTPQ